MIGEALLAALSGILGWSILTIVGLPRTNARVAIAAALPVGLIGGGLVTAVLVALGLPFSASWSLIVTTLAVVGAIVAAHRATEVRAFVVVGFVAVGIGVGLTAVLYLVGTPVLTYDSFQFIRWGRALSSDRLPVEAAMNYPLVVTHLQAMARTFGSEYILFVTGAAGLLGIGAALEAAVSSAIGVRSIRNRVLVGVGAASLSILAVSYILRVQVFYLNSHLLAASLVALTASLFHMTSTDSKREPLLITAAILLAGLSLVRLEGLLLVLLLLVFFVVATNPTPREAVQVGLIALVAPALWYMQLVFSESAGGILSPSQTAILLVACTGPLVVATAPRLDAVRRWLPEVALSTLALAVVVTALVESEFFATSIGALVRNLLIDGLWGGFWWTIGPILLFALVLGRPIDGERAWQVLLLGFFAVVLVLGGVRELPFRVGWGDSANRMVVHVVPVALVYLVLKGIGLLGSARLHRTWLRNTGKVEG